VKSLPGPVDLNSLQWNGCRYDSENKNVEYWWYLV
jgi:hypothetical protein